MARRDLEFGITPSVLDRLIDLDPRASQESVKSQRTTVQEFKQHVKRDLEWLLNCRAYPGYVDDHLEEVPRSVALFGLPDFTGVNAQTGEEQDRLTQMMQSVIERFEPRFINVKITLGPVSNVDKSLKFHIEALLDLEPTPEPIEFDTVLQLANGGFAVTAR